MVFGCGGGGDTLAKAKVKGVVTFDSQPISEGRITFHSTDGKGRSYSGAITDGKYEFNAEPGPKKVEITASRAVPGKFDTTSNPGVKDPIVEMYIPKMYNEATKLTAEVAAGANDIPFDLKSK